MLDQLNDRYPNYRTLAYTLEEILVYDRAELKNSNQCYSTAITLVKKTSYTDYSVVQDIIKGLTEIIKDFK